MMNRRTFLKASTLAPAAQATKLLGTVRTLGPGGTPWRQTLRLLRGRLSPEEILARAKTYLLKEKYLASLSEAEFEAISSQGLGRKFWEQALGRPMLSVGTMAP